LLRGEHTTALVLSPWFNSYSSFIIYHCEKSDGDDPAAGEVFVARAQVKKAGRTLTVSTADAFAIKGGKEKVVATMLATIMAVPITRAK
jgi:hypothetical protein